MNDALIQSLERAVNAAPQDPALRLHLAQLLTDAARHAEALEHVNVVIQLEAGNRQALGLLATISTALAGAQGAETASDTAEQSTAEDGFDWDSAAAQLGDLGSDPFVSEEPKLSTSSVTDENAAAPLEPTPPQRITLADVGGLDAVKQRLTESFLAPLRNAEIAKAFGKSMRGGLLLYGPPGCGKTFLARAVAGELGASFLQVSMADVLSPYIGESEKNLRKLFDEARAAAPAVLFLDEIDALGLRRGSLTGSASWLRQMVNQLLLEMDSMASNNDGLYVLAATNHPWDLDEALLRPGRLDRSVLVSPPDAPARESILKTHLEQRPIARINLAQLAAQTDGFSGADLEHLCVTAAEKAMMQSIAADNLTPVSMDHMALALKEVKPSVLPWLEAARNVVRFSNENGRYDDLAHYLKSRGML
ncbi:AAA family ATPase [Glutamicibacter endophyticus]|uniref:AAA family ATPase n=1 Tax=Glutamicibacter endophyticus TaxID=1522174 RepID=UPI003AF1007C